MQPIPGPGENADAIGQLRATQRNRCQRQIAHPPHIRIRRRRRVVSSARHGDEIARQHPQRLQHRRHHRLPGDHQPGAEHHQGHAFVDQQAQRVGQHPLERRTPLGDRGHDAAEPGFGQHDAGGGLGNVGRGRNRDAHLGLAQRRRVVGAVAAHADGVAGMLEGLHQAKLVLGKHPGINREIGGIGAIADLPGRADRPFQPNRAGDGGSGRRGIAGHHHNAHAQAEQLRQ